MSRRSAVKTRNAVIGFTLMEILVVLVIIAVLAVVAIPLYDGYTKKTKASEAWTELEHIAKLQEQLWTDFRQGAFVDDTKNAEKLVAYGAKLTGGRYFSVAITNVTGAGPTWTATAFTCFDARACSLSSYDYAFLITHDGQKASKSFGSASLTEGWKL